MRMRHLLWTRWERLKMPISNMNLASKIAVVSGASRGLGKAITQALIKEGAAVYGLARSTSDLENLASQLGSSFHPVAMDITDSDAVRRWVKENFHLELVPHILVNNAGSGVFGKIDELPLEKWKQMVDTNLHGMYYLTSALVPLMKAAGGHIINIGSILGKTTSGGKAAYSATKYAMQGMSEALFKELRGNNIKVSLVNPGSISTEFFTESGIQPNEDMLRPEEVAEVVIFLLKTPQNVLIDELTLRPLNPRR